jgi:hypothetical protein
VTYLRLFFEGDESPSDNFLEFLKYISSIMIFSSSGDNSKRIYEYDIDSETAKIKKSLFKFAFRIDKIS